MSKNAETANAATATATAAATETQQVVKNLAGLWKDQLDRVLGETTKAVDRSYVEAERIIHEGQRLTEVQMQAGRDLTNAMVEGAKRFTSSLS